MIDKNFLHISIDDLLGHGTSVDDMIGNLERVLKQAVETNLQFNVNKIRLFMHETKWCGRIYSSTGVKHDPARVEAFVKMDELETASQLNTFIHAIGTQTYKENLIPISSHIILLHVHSFFMLMSHIFVYDIINFLGNGLTNDQTKN